MRFLLANSNFGSFMFHTVPDFIKHWFIFFGMLTIEQLPEPPEGLALEVHELYRWYHDSQGFGTFFAENKAEFDLDDTVARRLDNLVECLADTYKMMSVVASGGSNWTALRFDIFNNALTGYYKETGIVDGGWNQEKPPQLNPDSTYLFGLTSQLQDATRKIPDNPEGRQDVFDALMQKLSFESTIYDAMKRHYGVVVSIPSLQNKLPLS